MGMSARQMVPFPTILQVYSGGGGGFSACCAAAGWTATKANVTRDSSRTASEQVTRNSFMVRLLSNGSRRRTVGERPHSPGKRRAQLTIRCRLGGTSAPVLRNELLYLTARISS